VIPRLGKSIIIQPFYGPLGFFPGLDLLEQEIVSGCNSSTYYYYYYYYYYIHLTAFFQDNLGKPAPERQNHSGF